MSPVVKGVSLSLAVTRPKAALKWKIKNISVKIHYHSDNFYNISVKIHYHSDNFYNIL
jgi:hypothetical protein